MTHIIPFSFDSQRIRVVEQDGEPWFVLTDVCHALSLANPSVAAKPLAEDQRSKFNLGSRSGQAIIVSESGLYLIVMRSDDAIKPGTVAYRFTRWVTGEVIPSVRKTGSYVSPSIDMTPSLPDGISAVRETRYSFGKLAARQMWMKMGLPTVPAMFAPSPQGEFFIPA